MTASDDVSRETCDDLNEFKHLLVTWNAKINLIGRSTEQNIAARHIQDSLALLDILPAKGEWIDLGTGAGLPGVPIVVRGGNDISMTLIESDTRKCEFLKAVRRQLGLKYEIVTNRVEDISPLNADVIVSRAMASLATLLGHVRLHGHRSTISAFPKGRLWRREIADARRSWSFDLEAIPSRSDPDAAILRIENVRPI